MRSPIYEPSISTSVLLSIYNDLSNERALFNAGLKLFGIDTRELHDFHGQISLRLFVSLFEWLAQESHDPWLGLKISQRSGPDALGAVGYLFLSSGKLETALHSLARYLEAIQNSTRIDIVYLDDLVQVRYCINDETISPRRQDSEFSIGLIWRYIRLLSRNKCRLVQVSFEHDRPQETPMLPHRIFQSPVLFNAESNSLVIPKEDFQCWHEGHDPHLLPILEHHISHTLAQLESVSTFTESVTHLITNQLLDQGARADLVARLMNISTATLHRRLRIEGSRFKELVDMRSKDLATRLLSHSNLPIATISRQLGFTDPSTFSRAYRRWFNVTPRDYRKMAREQRLTAFRVNS
jgi:AraC-like DNA-binding protein